MKRIITIIAASLLTAICVSAQDKQHSIEIGSIVKVKDTFLVKSSCFTVDENRMEGCKASIRIYRITDDGNLNNIVTMPIYPEGQEKDDLPHCTAGKSGVRAWRVLHQFRPDRNF